MIPSHLAAIQIILPLLAAPACVLLHRASWTWALASVISLASLVVSALLLNHVLEYGPLVYALGGWAAPWGIEYRVDSVSAYVLLIVTAISSIALLYAKTSVEKEIPQDRIYLFYTGWLLCLTGLLGITITGDAFNLFVFLEISSLSSYMLVGLGPSRRSLTAAFQYLVLGTIGATFILIGIGLMYMMTGTLNMADLAARLPEVYQTRTITAAFAFLILGIAIKMALFPMHFWLPNAYTYAPSAVSVFLAGTATKVAVYIWLRFFFTVFGGEFTFGDMELDRIVIPLAVAGFLVASIVAVFQTNAKRLLAYSSVAQVGYIILGISLVSVTGITAGILHLFNHAMIKAALFMAMGAVMFRIGSVAIADMSGLSRRMPWTMAAFVVGGLSLIGIPLTVGFISKWYLILAVLEKEWWSVAALVLISSLIAMVYIGRVVEAAYFRPLPKKNSGVQEAPLSLLLPMWILVGANIYFGIDTSLTVGVAQHAARSLLGAGS